MNRIEKETQIVFLKQVVEEAQSLIFVDFTGLTVGAVTAIRREFRENGCEYRVIKNTLLAHVVKGTKAECVEKFLFGPVAIVYSRQEPALPAKIALKCAKERDKFKIRGAYLDGAIFEGEGVRKLSTLPSKKEIQSKLLATMLAVPQGMMRLMLAAPQRMLMVLEARKRQLEEGKII
jgi:large subunit ribosomal protein L10